MYLSGAILNIDAGNFKEAIATFEILGEYSNSVSYLKKARLVQKYAQFNQNLDKKTEEARECAVTSPEEAEEILNTSLYKTWYHSETGEELFIDCCQIDSCTYFLNELTSIDGFISSSFCYVDNPDNELYLSTEFKFFDYIEKGFDVLTISDNDTEEVSRYYSITKQEYDELLAQDQEAAAHQPVYSENEIIEKTFNTFKNKVKGNYSGAGTLYHSAEYSEAYVNYDWSTQTYSCTLVGEYSTNVFDLWGTSTQSYFVAAIYLDTGAGLSTISFSIS